ncbi:ATPase [Paenibacillus motobuensis]|uniref:N-acetylglucosamine kinase n=1 Tax=Paenibacillus TaxID=44249 RepID=UPI00203CE45A|nr:MULTISPECIES: BadF/BadG/BcrA/BcrD ATPase family protein [Paenibacillus]MCM3038582.1 ATPase [Paenibacillus lutimineralis]MCM3645686.1 ATPase [Paenibacillus motobuensis]
MNYYLGVDAGGSKTHCLLVNAKGETLGRGASGNGNHQTDPRNAGRNIASACNQALREAGLSVHDITHAFFGLAGADREADYRILRPMIAELNFPDHSIACDTMIAMRAGSEHPYGAVIISGTGFNAAARNRAGEELQYGGFGFLFGDGQGSGRDLANFAFRSAVRAWDRRGKSTLLTDLVLQASGFASVPQMLDAVLDGEYIPPLELAKLMFEAAEQGDEVATSILVEQGVELGNAASALIVRLGMEQEEFNVVLGGSILSKVRTDIMRDAIKRRITLTAPRATITRITMDPVAGAVLSAMDRDGQEISPQVKHNLSQVSFSDLKGEVQ